MNRDTCRRYREEVYGCPLETSKARHHLLFLCFFFLFVCCCCWMFVLCFQRCTTQRTSRQSNTSQWPWDKTQSVTYENLQYPNVKVDVRNNEWIGSSRKHEQVWPHRHGNTNIQTHTAHTWNYANDNASSCIRIQFIFCPRTYMLRVLSFLDCMCICCVCLYACWSSKGGGQWWMCNSHARIEALRLMLHDPCTDWSPALDAPRSNCAPRTSRSLV